MTCRYRLRRKTASRRRSEILASPGRRTLREVGGIGAIDGGVTARSGKGGYRPGTPGRSAVQRKEQPRVLKPIRRSDHRVDCAGGGIGRARGGVRDLVGAIIVCAHWG